MEEKKKFVLNEQEIREGIVPLIGEKDLGKYKTWLVESYMPNHPDFDLHSHDDRETLAKALADEAIKWSEGKEEYAGMDDLTLRDALRTESWAMAMFDAYIDEKLSYEEKWGVYNQSCVCIAPYQDWGDGIKGCVLVRDWNTDNPMAFLVDNDVRTTGHERVFRNTFYPYETRIYYHYAEVCEQENDGYALATKEDYAKYHIVSLAGILANCLIDDVACYGINMNEARQGNRTVFSVNRFQKRLAKDREKRKMASDIQELLEMENVGDWRQQIVMKVLKQRGASEYVQKSIIAGKEFVLEYLKGLLNKDCLDKAWIGKRLIADRQKNPEEYCWWESLEDIKEPSGNYMEKLAQGCSIKSVLAYAAYVNYLVCNLSFESRIGLGELIMDDRLNIFENYITALKNIALRDLTNENNPRRISLPSHAEAKSLAIRRANEYLEKEPEWIPIQDNALYDTYVGAFFEYCKPKKNVEKIEENWAEQLPTKDKYVWLTNWIEEEKKMGRDWYLYGGGKTRKDMCILLSRVLGWEVDENSLGKAYNRKWHGKQNSIFCKK